MEELKLIRREKEMAQLWDAYEALKKGQCQLRFITGEAGTGKSVLMDMFVQEPEEKAENTLLASTFCCIRSEYSIPYQPFKELLKQLLQEVHNNEETARQERSRGKKLKDAIAFSARMLLKHAGILENICRNALDGATAFLPDSYKGMLEELGFYGKYIPLG